MKKYFSILLTVLMVIVFCSCAQQDYGFDKYLAGRELYVTAQLNNMGESLNDEANELFVKELNRHLTMSESDSHKLHNTYHELIDTVSKEQTNIAVDMYNSMLMEMIEQCLDKKTQIEILSKYHFEEKDIVDIVSEYAQDLFGQQLMSEAYFSKYKNLSSNDESMNFWNRYSNFEKEMIDYYTSR